MSQENVKVVHRYAAALNAREVPEELLAPDFVMVNATTAVTDKTYRGRAGVRGGKLTRVVGYLGRREALEAVGFAE
jgi:hypothetical protein